jgi:putative transposase
MERKFEFSTGEFYHLYNRGNNKATIFISDADKNRFIKLLFACNSDRPLIFKTIQSLTLDKIERGDTLIDIGAYCLMPNHFHLLIHEKKEGGASLFMQKLTTAYSMYLNKRYNRTGKPFEGTFRATHADTDEYLKYLFSYIHLNPVKLIDPEWKERGITDNNKARTHLAEYRHSSYLDYIHAPRAETAILNREVFPEYFEAPQDLESHINDWLNYKNDEPFQG